jgi:hypothetical protein
MWQHFSLGSTSCTRPCKPSMSLYTTLATTSLVLASLWEQLRWRRELRAAIRAFGAAQHELIRVDGCYTMDCVTCCASAVMRQCIPQLKSFSRKRTATWKLWAMKLLQTGLLSDALRSDRALKMSHDGAREVLGRLCKVTLWMAGSDL